MTIEKNIKQQVLSEIGRVIKGKDDVVKKVFMAILAEGHVLIEDIPGVGKTTLALALSRVLGVKYGRIQFTPDVVPSDIIGFTMYNKETGSFEYREGAVFCNLFLADEINRTSSKTQSALLEVMEEGQATVDGQVHVLPKPFTVIATQNPAGGIGTQMLPQAQMDRFLIKIKMGYPDYESQIELLRDRQIQNPLDMVKVRAEEGDVVRMQEETRKVHTSEEILDYITRLTIATRQYPLITIGISPRGAIALSRMAKACAYLNDRDYVIPDDVQEVFLDVCAHRIILNSKARVAEKNEAEILTDVLCSVPVETKKK